MSEIPNLMRGGHPQFYRGNDIGCLVVHGFMASPAEVGWAGQHLAQQGYTVYMPRLTGHGIDPTHMARMRWQDWYGQVLDSYHILRQQCETVVLIGHSMGGLLSLLVAAEHPVDALAVSASPITLRQSRRSLRYARLISLFLPYTNQPNSDDLAAEIAAEQKKRGEPATNRVHYDKWSSRALSEFAALEAVAQANLARVTAPLLLLYAEQDTAGTVSDAQHIAAHVRSNHIETTILEDGGHIVFQDKGRDKAFAALADYVARITSQEKINHV